MSTVRTRESGLRVTQILVGAIIVVWSLLPLYWGAVVAFSSAADIRKSPVSLIPRNITFENFQTLLGGATEQSTSFYQALMSSTIEASGATLLTLLIALPAAYAFARLKFRGAKVFLGVITLMFAVPVYLVVIPLFQMVTAVHQLNTYQAVIVVLTSAALPLAIWILRSHIATLPEDLESAARLDGAGTFRILTRIIAPLVAPGVVAAAVVVFLTAWGEFFIPLIYANVGATQPITILIPTFASKFADNLGLQAAAGLTSLLPPLLLVILLQKRLLSGLLTGASR